MVLRRMQLLLFMAALAFVIVGLGANPAQSHRIPPFGGSWPHTRGAYLYMPYTINPASGLPQGWYTAINGAMYAWYKAPTRVWPYLANANTSVVDFYVAFYNEDWFGYTELKPCYGRGCKYTLANLYMNRTTLDNETVFQSQKSSAHEFGHSLGLSHPCATSPCRATRFTSVMFQGILTYNVPQNHDINDVNRLYP
jgi:hypothetical protein